MWTDLPGRQPLHAGGHPSRNEPGFRRSAWHGQAADRVRTRWRGKSRSHRGRHASGAGRARRAAGSAGRLIEENVPVRFAETKIPLHVVATDVLSGEEARLSSGLLVEAVLASAAIPAVFPPVTMGGRMLVVDI